MGSNVARERNVSRALARLEARFGRLTVSSLYESDPVGFEGARFYNLAVALRSSEPPSRLVKVFRGIERASGRIRQSPKFGPRTLDLDLLLYDDLVLDEDGITLPRDEITRFAYVLGPLAEICGERRHPVSGIRIADLWAGFDDPAQRIRRLPLDVRSLMAQALPRVYEESTDAARSDSGP